MTKSLKSGGNGLGAGVKEPKPVARPGVAKVRKLSPMGSDTRNKLLNAAERLFAYHGYDGTSLRDISNEAGLHMALCTYYFGKKEHLFEEVIRRRAVALEKERLTKIRAVDLTRLDSSEAIDLLIKAYTTPILNYRFGRSKQRRAYVRLISQLFNLENWADALTSNYMFSTKLIIDSLQAALPDANKNDLVNAYSHLVASLLFICSHPNRFDELRYKPDDKSENMESVISDFFKFNHTVFMSL
jgi:AcrR family transcriptional regulator